ncbi:hypothetical protein GCM10009759_48020 [Kitasatospora saccharophila]|uniref:Uncharacterized protein n=1 Tax=Kitasatospora saccharophila TaxID=407973 RepID=A0ABP5IXA6_9ACTN
MGGGAVGGAPAAGLRGEGRWCELDWQIDGCERAVGVGVDAERIITAWSVDHLLAWAGAR